MADFQNTATMFEGSEQSLREELTSMKLPRTDITCLYSADFMKIYPLQSSVDSFSPIEFLIQTDSTSMLDLYTTLFSFTCRIKKADGTAIPADETVALGQHFFSQLFRNVETSINDKLISDSCNLYPYCSYIHKLVTLPQAIKDSELENEIWYPDTTVDSYVAANTGYKARKELIAGSKPFTMVGRLSGGIFNQIRWLPSGTTVRITLRRSEPEFCLVRPTLTHGTGGGQYNVAYKIEIDEPMCLVSRKPLNPTIMTRLSNLYDKGESLKFVLDEPQIRLFNVPDGVNSINCDSLILGRIPKYIIVGLVKSDALNGSLLLSPFNFSDFNVKELTVNWNADTVQQRVIPLSFSGNGTTPDNYLMGLISVQKLAADKMQGNGLKVSNYKNGNVLYGVELLPTSEGCLSVNRRGQLKLSISFRSLTPAKLTAVVFCMYQNVLEISKANGVQLDA